MGPPDAVEVFGGRAASFVKDDLSAGGRTDQTVFIGLSDKNTRLIGTWEWKGGNVPAKDDVSKRMPTRRGTTGT